MDSCPASASIATARRSMTVGHGHSHGLVDESIKRSREGIRAVSLSLVVLGLAARIRTAAGKRLDSAALIADGEHARADAYVSLAVIASAVVVALGLPAADPLIGLLICVVILRIAWQSWVTVRGHDHTH